MLRIGVLWPVFYPFLRSISDLEKIRFSGRWQSQLVYSKVKKALEFVIGFLHLFPQRKPLLSYQALCSLQTIYERFNYTFNCQKAFERRKNKRRTFYF